MKLPVAPSNHSSSNSCSRGTSAESTVTVTDSCGADAAMSFAHADPLD